MLCLNVKGKQTLTSIVIIMEIVFRFNNQCSELRFGTYKFGPIVMRMFHVLNKPLEALEVSNT